jgi:hypothetical protein
MYNGFSLCCVYFQIINGVDCPFTVVSFANNGRGDLHMPVFQLQMKRPPLSSFTCQTMRSDNSPEQGQELGT